MIRSKKSWMNSKLRKAVKVDLDLTIEDLKELVSRYKQLIVRKLGKEFPSDPKEQLWGAIGAVFMSWERRAPSCIAR